MPNAFAKFDYNFEGLQDVAECIFREDSESLKKKNEWFYIINHKKLIKVQCCALCDNWSWYKISFIIININMLHLFYSIFFLAIVGISGNEADDKKCEEYFLNVTESLI